MGMRVRESKSPLLQGLPTRIEECIKAKLSFCLRFMFNLVSKFEYTNIRILYSNKNKLIQFELLQLQNNNNYNDSSICMEKSIDFFNTDKVLLDKVVLEILLFKEFL